MEGLYINSTSQDQSYNYSTTTSNYQNHSNPFVINVLTSIIIAIGLPLTFVALYALYSMVRRDHVAPIYVINLLISDLLQFCCMIIEVVPNVDWNISNNFYYIYISALLASVYFMVCISLERYLVIVHPLWYRFRRTIKTSVVVCVLVWVLSVFCFCLYYFFPDNVIIYTVSALLLLPFPPLIFFLVGTLKALSASISVPSDEKRRIVGILVLVLLIYTLLFLPFIIWYLEENYFKNLDIVSLMFVKLSPLADSVLYVFMKKGFIDKLLACVCSCRMDSNDISRSSVSVSSVSVASV